MQLELSSIPSLLSPSILNLTDRTPLEINPRAFMGYPRFLQHTHLFDFIWASLFYIFYLASNSLLLPFSYFWNFHLAHSWSTICSGHTVPREMGVAREEAFVTLAARSIDEQVLDGTQDPSHGPGVCVVKVEKLRHYYFVNLSILVISIIKIM